MRSKAVGLLVILGLTVLLTVSMASAQQDGDDYVETSEVADVPFLGIYIVPVLGALRRRRHDLNNRSYDPVSAPSSHKYIDE